MNDQEFFKSFIFGTISMERAHHRDNSAGVPVHYFGYMVEGKGLLVAENEKIEVFPGDLFYIPKGCRYHSYWTGEDGSGSPGKPEKIKFYSFGFTYFPKTENKRYLLQKLPISAETHDVLQKLFDDHTVSPRSVGLLYSLIGCVEDEMISDRIDRRSEITERAIELMYKDPSAGIDEISKDCSVSQSTLYLVFKKTLGKTPNTVRQEIKCEKAAELLKNTSLSVEEISRELDFSSSSYFRKVLFSVSGKTPRQIRREARTI